VRLLQFLRSAFQRWCARRKIPRPRILRRTGPAARRSSRRGENRRARQGIDEEADQPPRSLPTAVPTPDRRSPPPGRPVPVNGGRAASREGGPPKTKAMNRVDSCRPQRALLSCPERPRRPSNQPIRARPAALPRHGLGGWSERGRFCPGTSRGLPGSPAQAVGSARSRASASSRSPRAAGAARRVVRRTDSVAPAAARQLPCARPPERPRRSGRQLVVSITPIDQPRPRCDGSVTREGGSPAASALSDERSVQPRQARNRSNGRHVGDSPPSSASRRPRRAGCVEPRDRSR